MASFRAAMRSGHPPTLFAAFLSFDFCFAIWVLEIGALGGAILPNVMGLSKQWTGNFGPGFLICAAFTAAVFLGLRLRQRRWTRTWVGPGAGPAGARA